MIPPRTFIVAFAHYELYLFSFKPSSSPFFDVSLLFMGLTLIAL